MKKTLRSLTVIPPELYVERGADRQLANIVENMGRPGYVLVARQMGKTNLLLHAKRKLARQDDVFAYLDVSNPFPDLRAFLRNVIDVICDTSPSLQKCAGEIAVARGQFDRLPHKEHEWELRTLLERIPGKLTVCLDEIDALTSSSYSDQVFSFIRSVYFSGRANFPELARLTYLLSGVAEPADIIKNREVSPFNIGEKILLNDFSLAEFGTFLIKANLKISELARERIYWWVSGHPRMSWDLCSRLEDLALEGHSITPRTVDDAVRKLYFAEVSMPPVDQVKKLAEESGEMRDALMSLHYGRADSIADSTRTKLYLAGVSRMSTQPASTGFKNKVLEEVLSEAFLLSVTPAASHEDSLDVAQREFASGQYTAALSTLTRALRAAEDVEDVHGQGIAHYWFGRAYFALGQDEHASQSFATAATLLSGESAVINTFYSGHLSLAKGDQKQAISAFEIVVRDASSKAIALEASVDLASALVLTSSGARDARAEALCVAVCSAQGEIVNSPGLERPGGDTVALAHHTLATILARKGLRRDALEELDKGLTLATIDAQIRLLLLKHEIALQDKEFYLFKCKSIVLTTHRFSSHAKPGEISLGTCSTLLERLERARKTPDAEEVVTHIVTCASEIDGQLSEVVGELAVVLLSGGNSTVASLVLEQALIQSKERMPLEERRRALSTLLSIAPEKSLKNADRFLDAVEEQGFGVLSSELLFINNIVFYAAVARVRHVVERAVALAAVEPSDFTSLTEAQRADWRLLVDYLSVLSQLSFEVNSRTIDAATRLLRKLREERAFSLPKFKPEFAASMAETVRRLLREQGARVNLRRARKIGRNEIVFVKYGDEVKRGKFKYFESDLVAGRCSLTDPQD